MNDRLNVLSKVDELLDNNCSLCSLKANNKHSYCMSECPVGKDLKKLGEQLLKPSQERTKAILRKGKYLTHKEIKFLLDEKNVTQREVAQAMGITKSTLERMMNEFNKRQKEIVK